MPRVACPHCNAIVEAEGDRAECPRCTETFDTTLAEHVLDQPIAVIPPTPRPQGFLYSRWAMAISIGLSLLILIVGLAIVRPWESKPKSDTPTKLPVVVSPLGLSGLSYIPAKANVLVAIQPMPLLVYAAQSKTNPRQLLTDAGIPSVLLDRINQSSISLDQIDHLIIGLSVSDEPGSLLPGLTACLRLTRPVSDESQLLSALKAEKNSQRSKDGRTVYSLNVGLPLLMTAVDDRTYLFGLGDSDLSALKSPHPIGGAHLNTVLRESLTSRVSPTSFLWLATTSEKWNEKPIYRTFEKSAFIKPFADLLPRIRAVAMGLAVEEEPFVRVNIEYHDPMDRIETVSRWRERFPEPDAVSEFESWVALRTPWETIKSNPQGWLSLLQPK